MHIYMHKLKLNRALFVMLNKDNQELYFERVEYDKVLATHLLLRGHEIADMKQMPDRRYKSKTFYKCKFCNWNKDCWEE